MDRVDIDKTLGFIIDDYLYDLAGCEDNDFKEACINKLSALLYLKFKLKKEKEK